jgi:hypothetical protein
VKQWQHQITEQGKIMARKTVNVSFLKQLSNEILANSVSEASEVRNGVIIVLETVLLETDNYKGFRYLYGWEEDNTLREYY